MTKRGQDRLPGMGGSGQVARMRRAVDSQFLAQRALGHIEPVDAGLIGLARTIADAMDVEVSTADANRYTVGMLAGRLLPVLLELRGPRYDRVDGFTVDDELEQLKAALRDAAGSRPADDRS